ncbi:hypothetical protein LI82_06600 [Methanococcoides methylutens]|uniref:Uncharacterized protein n=1 Tax=Methanococcoides methylutens TaxID=2226 RepID=A0A099T2V4_METMT|nr:hypothetical protein [Methanococcoides methylutens]KGK98541.1 hypothetical protein LI82_06600 [Methanococcoides methylutens]
MESENTFDKKVATIRFFIDAAKYHQKNLIKELNEGNQPSIDLNNFGVFMQSSKRREIPIPVTIGFQSGYAIELYEFYSFINSIMAAVNSIIDLKCRIVDGYSDSHSFSFGQYMNPKVQKKLSPSKSSISHNFIFNNSEWIEEIKEIRNTIQHQPVQDFIEAYLIFRGEKDEDGNVIDKSVVKKFVPLKNDDSKEISEFCQNNLKLLEIFWQQMSANILSNDY